MGSRASTVFIGPTEVAGFCAALSSGFREIGWASHTIDVGVHPFRYGPGESHSAYLAFMQWAFGWLVGVERRVGIRLLFYPLRRVLMVGVFIWAIFTCGNFIYIVGRSLLPWHIDLWLLKTLRRPVLHVYLGSDSRPPFLSGHWLADHSDLAMGSMVDLTVRRSRRQRARLQRIYNWSKFVIDNPMSALAQPHRFINWFYLGFPTTLTARGAPSASERGQGEMTVIHAPSDRRAKGSVIIDAVLEELQSEGLCFRYVTLRGVPNPEVQRMLADAHVVVDQLYSDTPLAGLGSEAAAHGCAVVVGGHGWAELEAMVPPEMLPHSLRVTEANLKEELRVLLASPARCRDLGGELREFVEEKWAAKQVASRYAQLLEGQPDEAWWVDEAQMRYVGGMGARPNAFRPLIKAIVDRHGIEGLGLSPSLGRRVADAYATSES